MSFPKPRRLLSPEQVEKKRRLLLDRQAEAERRRGVPATKAEIRADKQRRTAERAAEKQKIADEIKEAGWRDRLQVTDADGNEGRPFAKKADTLDDRQKEGRARLLGDWIAASGQIGAQGYEPSIDGSKVPDSRAVNSVAAAERLRRCAARLGPQDWDICFRFAVLEESVGRLAVRWDFNPAQMSGRVKGAFDNLANFYGIPLETTSRFLKSFSSFGGKS